MVTLNDLRKVYPELTAQGVKDFIAFKALLKPYMSGEKLEIKSDICSPIPGNLRNSGHTDTNASFGLYISKDGRVRWKDWGVPKSAGNSPADLAIYIVEGIKTYKDGADLVDRLVDGAEVDLTYLTEVFTTPPAKRPELVFGELKDEDYSYWDRYWLTPKQMAWSGTFLADKVLWESGAEWESTVEDPIYVYIFEGTRTDPKRFKLYRPLTSNRKVKFKSFNDGRLEGLQTLQRINRLRDVPFVVPQSSYKDSLVSTIHAGVHALAPSGEGHYQCWKDQISDVERIAPITAWAFDGDKVGTKSARKNALHFGGIPFDMEGRYGEKYDPVKEEVVKIKDPSDFLDKEALHPKTKQPLGNTPEDLASLYRAILKEHKIV